MSNLFTNTFQVLYEEIKIGDDRITYNCSNKFNDACKTIDLKSFEQDN